MATEFWVLDMVRDLQEALKWGDTMTVTEEREWTKIQDKVDNDEPLSDADVNFVEKQHRRYA